MIHFIRQNSDHNIENFILQAPGRKSVLKICNKHDQDTPPLKKTRRSSCVCFASDASSNGSPSKRISKKVRRNLLHDFLENECSKGNIEDTTSYMSSPSRKVSTPSVIYVGTTNYQDVDNISVVDLTCSSDSLSSNANTFYSKSLKTVYFPSRNFDRSITLRKKLVTTSLVNLPIIRKPLLRRRLFSASELCSKNKQKLSFLNIPNQFLNLSDLYCNEANILMKAVLTESDQKIIDWILDQEVNKVKVSSASNDISSLETGFDSIQELCERYNVSSNSTFD